MLMMRRTVVDGQRHYVGDRVKRRQPVRPNIRRGGRENAEVELG